MTTSIYSLPFWKATFERAVRTGIQAFIPAAGGAAFSIIDIDWGSALGITASAMVLSILMSLLAGLNGTGPSLVDSEIKTDAVVLDEVELTAEEAQKALDRMVVDGEVDDQAVPDESSSVELSAADVGGDADPEGAPDTPGAGAGQFPDGAPDDAIPEGEVDLTPPPEGWTPRH